MRNASKTILFTFLVFSFFVTAPAVGLAYYYSDGYGYGGYGYHQPRSMQVEVRGQVGGYGRDGTYREIGVGVSRRNSDTYIDIQYSSHRYNQRSQSYRSHYSSGRHTGYGGAHRYRY